MGLRYSVIATDASGNEWAVSDHARIGEAIAAADAIPSARGLQNVAVWDKLLGRWVKEHEMPWAEMVCRELEYIWAEQDANRRGIR